MKVKIRQKKDNKFLIERYYKEIELIEYIVCLDYDFNSNTYNRGIKVYSLPKAYDIFNNYVNTGNLRIFSEVEQKNDCEGIDQ